MRALPAVLPILGAALLVSACGGDISGSAGEIPEPPSPQPAPLFTAEMTGTWAVSFSGHQATFNRGHLCFGEWECVGDRPPFFDIELSITRIDGRLLERPYSRLLLRFINIDTPVPGTYPVNDDHDDAQSGGSPIASVSLGFPRTVFGRRSGTVEITSVTPQPDLVTTIQGTFAFDIRSEQDTVRVEGAFDVPCGPCYRWFPPAGM